MGETDNRKPEPLSYSLPVFTAFLANLLATVAAIFPAVSAHVEANNIFARGPYGGLTSLLSFSFLYYVLGALLLSQAIVYAVARRCGLGGRVRAAVLLAPSLLAVVTGAYLWTHVRTPLDDLRTRYVLSPSARYTAYADTTNGSWRFSFYEAGGRVLGIDTTDIGASEDAIWAWDSGDRFWVRRVRAGRYYYWEREGGKWVRKEWDRLKALSDSTPPKVPPELW